MRNRQSVHMARMWCGARDSAVLEGVVWQSFRLDGRKVCNIKRADISQVGRNKATVCVVPSSHLPLTREARTWCEARDSAKQTERSLKGKGDSARQRDYCTFAMVVRIEGVDATEAIPPVVARILSGDSTSPLTRDGHGCPKLNAQSFARMRNQQSVHMASVVVQSKE